MPELNLADCKTFLRFKASTLCALSTRADVAESSALLARSGSGDPVGLNDERLELTAESPSVSSAELVPLSSTSTPETATTNAGTAGGFELGGDMLPPTILVAATAVVGRTVSSLRLNAGEYLGSVG